MLFIQILVFLQTKNNETMKKLLSLPPNLTHSTGKNTCTFHTITHLSPDEYFCTCDPEGRRIGSGGGSTWLLMQAYQHSDMPFDQWLAAEKRILLHAGGQSKRLPGYATSGKILTPIPVFRWERGQRLSQDLLSLQLPLYERIMQAVPDSIHTMIVSGDVLIRAGQSLPTIPEADVVCFGLWLDASVAKNHGVFVSERQSPQVLKMMLQKPSVEELSELQKEHYYLTDIGVWMLSDRAVKVLMKKSTNTDVVAFDQQQELTPYDLYSDFGRALGTNPVVDDDEVAQLSVAILPLPEGEFYHFGTSRELISSTLRLQNRVSDQREIMHHDRKPHPSIFVQNAHVEIPFTADNTNIWIENSYIGKGWQLTHDNIVTGVPENDWNISLQPGECIDVVPVGENDYEVRRYRIDEAVDSLDMQERANLQRLFLQREQFRNENWSQIARNWEHSVFYQLDLDDAARQFKDHHLPMPEPLPASAPLMTRIHDAMFRGDSDQAFGLLREALVTPNGSSTASQAKVSPRLSVYNDQIVWGRSPVRIDIAGGWTDTPPYCMLEGGNVVNLAIELNGQPPLQVYIKPCKEPKVILRSIDLGANETIETYEQLAQFNKVGSPFSIPKAALALAGFLPMFSNEHYPSLRTQLETFGGGIELTLLSAIPAGSGLGTSSILAATVLGAVSDFCALSWDKNEIGHRTLMLEQMLTTGGGWQDQFGGVLGGVKLLQTERGLSQTPLIRWLPADLYTRAEYAQCHLLYYTGITRTAKHILSEIVRRMFLNQGTQQQLLRQMKQQALDIYEAIQRQDFERMGLLVRKTWQQNQMLDSGTNPEEVRKITDLIDDLCLGYKLPGAGGGGYLYMVAKDPDAAARIKKVLTENQQHSNARFVDMNISMNGLQVSRS